MKTSYSDIYECTKCFDTCTIFVDFDESKIQLPPVEKCTKDIENENN